MANKIIIFTAGAVTMILEILGARILTPHLGATIIVWAGVIGVILGSIGLGYYLGGRIAHKKLASGILASILAGAAAFTLFIIPIQNKVSELGTYYSYGFRSIIASLALFAIPAILLGMAIIYIIRLETKNLNALGSTNGTLYGISTAGSIIGVFLTSFYLIPNYAVSDIILVLGIVLFIAALIALIPRQKN